MKAEAQRIAIAEACPESIWQNSDGRWFWKRAEDTLRFRHHCINNDPLSDLNAMHEAEKVLTYDQWIDYVDNLNIYAKAKATDPHEGYEAIHATAAQRAEAFLRTLNLWDDTK